MQYSHVITAAPLELDKLFDQACSIQTHTTWESNFFTDRLEDLEVQGVLPAPPVRLIKFIIRNLVSLDLPICERAKSRFTYNQMDYLVVVDSFGGTSILSFSRIEDNYNILYGYEGNFSSMKPTMLLLGISEYVGEDASSFFVESPVERAIRRYEDKQPKQLNRILRDGFDRLLQGKQPSESFVLATDYLKQDSKEYLEHYNDIVSKVAGVRNMITYGGIPVTSTYDK